MRTTLLWGLPFLVLLHQDVWLWNRSDFVFGFLPIGLAYHAAYTIAVFIYLSLLVQFAWPADLEDSNDSAKAEESAT